MDDVTPPLHMGAEAEVRPGRWMGRAAMDKRRVPKTYRHPELDQRIRHERLRIEAQLLAAARRAGVPTPIVYDVDVAHHTLRMEHIEGDTLRHVLGDRPDEAPEWLATWGAHIGRLHTAGLVHGDLTTSNAVVSGHRLVLIDFGLALRSRDVEDHGTDLVLAQRTLESTHPDRAAAWFATLLSGYRSTHADAEAAIRRMQEIRARARYV